MTYYELIRACLIKDAEQHPYPKKGCWIDLSQKPKKQEQEQEDKPDFRKMRKRICSRESLSDDP